MEYTDKLNIGEQIIINAETKESLKKIWVKINDFKESKYFSHMDKLDKREIIKIESKIWNLFKKFYKNDMLFEESNTTEGTINI